MRLLQIINSFVFLLSYTITALTVKEGIDNGDDTASFDDIQVRPVAYQFSKNEKDNVVSTLTKSSFMNHKENVIGGNNMKISNLGRTALSDKKLLWPNATVYYEIGTRFPGKEKRMINKAIDTIEFWTCVRFKHRVNEPDYVFIHTLDKRGCNSQPGRQGGKQWVLLEARSCFVSAGAAMHELLHVLGIIHEHSRPDRDKFVNITTTTRAHQEDLKKYSTRVVEDFGVPYDYNSIMHYQRNPFPNVTVTPKQAQGRRSRMGQYEGLTARDVIKIRRLYNCQYKINYTQHFSKVLPNADSIRGDKYLLWQTFFGNPRP